MSISANTQQEVIEKLIDRFGAALQNRITTGVRQTAQHWQAGDGTAEEFTAFCLENFIADPDELDTIFERFQNNLESLYGNLHRIYRDFNWMLHVDAGEMLQIDHYFAGYDVYAHDNEDFYKTRLAFVILLNYPIPTLEEKSKTGTHWSRKKWAEARLAERFAYRIPATVTQQHTQAYTQVENYIYNYNIRMDRLFTEQEEPLFPANLNLICHWGLRDELKGQYASPDGLPRQEVIQKIMERVITQEIPRQIINKSDIKWNPLTNELRELNSGKEIKPQPEANRRYEALWHIFKAEQLIDPFTPNTPTFIDRRFKQNREIAEEEVESLLQDILSAPVLKGIAALLQKRLKRKLRPFDIWYQGFKPGRQYTEQELDQVVAREYPTIREFQEGLYGILRKLGFTPEKARYLQQHIQVDPARGAGHALGARMRGDKAHLRSRLPKEGMNYKGFNTAMHELGHTVEQVFSMNHIDYYTLEGVPNTAFTEAFAFVFQGRDLEILGLTEDDPLRRDWQTLQSMWQTLEIAGVSLLDMEIWRWLYANPEKGPEKLKVAVIDSAKSIWNRYFAPLTGIEDQMILAIYSHIIYCGMYIPDYAIGHVAAFQIEDHLRRHNLAEEMERMCKLGRLAPQVWMQEAIGEQISARPMIAAAEKALKRIDSK